MRIRGISSIVLLTYREEVVDAFMTEKTKFEVKYLKRQTEGVDNYITWGLS
jgi:hypothetical protein